MSKNFMGRMWDFLGLVEEEDAWASAPPSPVAVTRPSSGNVRLIPNRPSDGRSATTPRPELPRIPKERTARSLIDVETEILQVDGFADCLHLTSWYKASVPVMLDLRFLPPEVAQGVVYYATGLVSFNQGEVSQVGDGLVLVSPPGVTVSPAEQARLEKIGMWPSSPDG
ncbi:MAG: cell division protein SepF [Acidimicrobiia bacterium]|nr:cell division protein SepF [Acidimicrobiia bacterium]MYA38669.1 cell division protein SepF [Acidimicrobiia bacterium]MYB79607.1 cell division protein SepF [Acidimicrobiia bacterium]MYD41168.1 cell division protein SepF [Acidimicrobiia bacterium]MYH05739.1 cell division protein SepF [Acidimicrobiia bacterium]